VNRLHLDPESGEPTREELLAEVAALRATVERLRGARPSADEVALHAVLDELEAGVVVLEESGRIAAANRAWHGLARGGIGPGPAGAGADFLAACAAATAGDAGEAAGFADDLRAVLAGRRGGFVAEFPWPGPEPRWFRARALPLTLGGVRRVLVGLEDVTGRRRAAAERADREGLLLSLFSSTPMMMGLAELEGDDIRLISVNQPVPRTLARREDALLGRPIGPQGVVPPEELALWLGRYRECWRTGRPVHFEYEAQLVADRRWLRAHVNFAGLGPEGRPRFSFLVEDVTDRRHAEEALRRSAERLVILHRIDLSISADQTPAEIARTVLRQLASILPYWRAGVIRSDDRLERGEVIAAEGHPADYAPGARHHIPDFYAPGELDALRRGECVERADVGDLPEPPPALRPLAADGMRSYFRAPLVIRGATIGVLSLYGDRPGQFTAEHREIARQVADSLAVALEHARLFAEVRSGRERLRELSRQLLRTQEDERRRLARELHDEVGQALTLLRLDLRRALDAGAGPAALARLAECDELVERTLEQVRGLSLDLRPSHLDHLGLVPALRSYLAALSRRTGLAIDLDAAEPDGPGPEVATALFRIAQEALTNVVRHAHAAEARVALWREGGDLVLEVRDDGDGFDVDRALERASAGGSLGLISMMERAALLGGRTEFASAPGRGATVRAALPIDDAAGGSGGGFAPGEM
jgi:signal transduction histidine kinase/PAS domain-containing protein